MITDRDIARWRVRSQLLAAPVERAEAAVLALLAVQAENPSQSAWAVAARTVAPHRADLAGDLTDGRVLRTHVLRPTWHYVHADDARWLLELTAPRVLSTFDVQLKPTAERLSALTDTIVELLSATPHMTRAAIAATLEERGGAPSSHQLAMLLGRLELLAIICSGAPRNAEHTYALMDDRVPPAAPLDREEALARLALRYLRSHGPATERDLAYWATLTVTDARRGIAASAHALASFEHDGRTFWHLRDDAPASPQESAQLLQILDEMYRGYQDSRWILDAEGVVPREREAAAGMVLCDAQLVAGMRRTVSATSVTFTVHPYRELTTRERSQLQDAATRYGEYLDLEPAVEFAGA